MNCKEGTMQIARQIDRLLLEMDARTFAQPLELLNGSTLGQHFRHIIEFYDCLLRGARRGAIDYAERERSVKIEADPQDARRAFEKICARLEDLREESPVWVKADFSTERRANRPRLRSSIGRELMFAYDHAVHHLAIIRIGIQDAFPHIPLDEELGVAPSTVKYRSGSSAADRSRTNRS